MTEHNVHEEESVRRSISSQVRPTVHVDGEIKEGRGGGRGEMLREQEKTPVELQRKDKDKDKDRCLVV